ncbi:MAG: hypothetical protein ACI4AK_09155 [Lepagella sp.]
MNFFWFMERCAIGICAVVAAIATAATAVADDGAIAVSVNIPEEATFTLGVKSRHYVDFTTVDPTEITTQDGTKTLSYALTSGAVYNYRTSMPEKLTQAGYFTAGASGITTLQFAPSDYEVISPKMVCHSVDSNQGYETGDIYLNINPRGHLVMGVDEVYDAHAMRTWQLCDNTINNYFIEPDFHYMVLDLDGNPCEDVVSITEHPGSAWAELTALSEGTAIVVVTYDALSLRFYNSSGECKDWLGGEQWGAIWPENSGVYVVTVGEASETILPNMYINQEYNESSKKLAGDSVDAEHDVFYYLDTEDGYSYTFHPEGVADITISYPEISDDGVAYHGFTAEGVTRHEDGSITLLLKEGRQIVRMEDADGKCIYQVLTARPCHREISNETHPDSEEFKPGDEVLIQYSGLRHPANKLAGIYNMSAYVTYNGVPNGTSPVMGSGQYTFGSAPSAQAIKVTIPDDEGEELVMTEGVIQVNGFGDPIGNHRNIERTSGRNPNMNAVAHKTYFGALPDIHIPITRDSSGIDGIATPDDADTTPVYYGIDGVASRQPRAGLNIIRTPEGGYKKLIIK